MAAYRSYGPNGRPRSSLLREKRLVPPGAMPRDDEEVRFYLREGTIERSSDRGGGINLEIRSFRAAYRLWRRCRSSVQDHVRPLPTAVHVMRTTWQSRVMRHSVYVAAMRDVVARHHLEALIENDRRERWDHRQRRTSSRLTAEQELRLRRLFERSGLGDVD